LGSHLPVVGGTRPERFSAFAITSHHSAACKRLTMASSSQCGFRNSRPADFAIAWSGTVAGLLAQCELWRRASLAHRKCQLLTRTCLDTVSRCRVPRMLTPRASSAGGAFTIECPAIDVLCHPKDTVCETSGFRHRLADSGSPPLSRVTVCPRPALTPEIRTALAPKGLRTVLLTIQNVFRRISELAEFYPVSRCYPPGCPHEASNTAYPFTRHLPRFCVFFFSATPRQRVPRLLSS
jgi:hypothetical protein